MEETGERAGGVTQPGSSTATPEPEVSFDTAPDRYRHWRLSVDGAIATLILDVAEDGGLVPGYELKANSYDLGVDIELHDAVQRLRFEYPAVRAVVVTSGKDRMFCAGANIRMLAASSHRWKVNFCKFTNETRAEIEDATECSGQTYIAALNGTAAGGGYELALACDQIVLVDDGSSAVALPEVPLLGVGRGTSRQGGRAHPAAPGRARRRDPVRARHRRARPGRGHRRDHDKRPGGPASLAAGTARGGRRRLAAGRGQGARRRDPAAAEQRAGPGLLADQDRGRPRGGSGDQRAADPALRGLAGERDHPVLEADAVAGRRHVAVPDRADRAG